MNPWVALAKDGGYSHDVNCPGGTHVRVDWEIKHELGPREMELLLKLDRVAEEFARTKAGT